MADPAELLTVAEAAARLRVSTKTIRRRILDGSIVAHRFGTAIRVDALSVTRLLVPATSVGTQSLEQMAEQTDAPRLSRQLSRNGNWIAVIDGKEVSAGTSDFEEAQKKLGILVRQTRRNTRSTFGRPKQGLWQVFEERGRGFVVLYYDENRRRKKHRVPSNLNPPVTTMEEAEAYAGAWFLLHEAGAQINDVHAVELPEVQTTARSGSSPTLDEKTFKEIAQLWTSGKLAIMYPDHVKAKRSGKTDEKRLARYAYSVIGDIPVSQFVGRSGIQLVEQVSRKMTELAPKNKPRTRRHVLQTVSMVLNLACYPLGLIESNPLPKGFVPKVGAKVAKSWLYPDEERRLLECARIPIEWRLLMGILSREGMRLSELLRIEWSDIDLAKGFLVLDKNKTDDPRSWALGSDVTAALRKWKRMLNEEALKKGRITLHPKSGRLISGDKAAARLRRYARRAGLDRSQLFERTDVRLPLRIHDLRATFVTTSLAQGRSEVWVTDRTGHRSSAMVFTYKRASRSFKELNLGPLSPLHESIPELAELDDE